MSEQISKFGIHISSDKLRLYADILQYKDIVYFENSVFKSLFQPETIYQELTRELLYIEDEEYKPDPAFDTITQKQLHYDCEVFENIPAEIRENLSAQGFLTFMQRYIDLWSGRGWKVVFSQQKNVLTRLEKEKNIKIQYLEDYVLQSSEHKVLLVLDGNDRCAEDFYDKNKNGHRIEKRRFLMIIRAWIIDLLCERFAKILGSKNVELVPVNWIWGLDHALYPNVDATSKDMEERNKYQISNLELDRPEDVAFLQKIYGKDFDADCVEEIKNIPPRIEIESGRLQHTDRFGRYMNVVNAVRYTAEPPETVDNTIYLFGGCVFFGYAVDDANTVASHLQRLLNERCDKKWKVVNMATWGGNFDQEYRHLYDITFKEGDIVLVSYAEYMAIGQNWESRDISKGLAECKDIGQKYFNSIVHCNTEGYACVAETVFRMLEDQLKKDKDEKRDSFKLQEIGLKEEKSSFQKNLYEYYNSVIQQCPWKDKIAESRIGAIVMNCNPFTLGHRYLIETAAGQVDYLIIFVVEENKSYFDFEDRIRLVKAGTGHLKNVLVVPSGSFIISTRTFPGYFVKDNPKEVNIDSSEDVQIFAKYIAPQFFITKRFVGEEPFDRVTRLYNETMKQILPNYGIEIIEIPRKETDDGVISASKVRKALENDEFDKIEKMVPESTLEFLKKMKRKR